jgi:copper transporter 1
MGFLSSSWHITSNGMFAGSCIGVLLLVISLEALRRASREYDAYIMRAHMKNFTSPATAASSLQDTSDDPSKTPSTQSTTPLLQPQSFTPNIFQQFVRAFLHMAQFAVAYIVMLLAMYYNGYLIICIFLGAFVGAFIFSWHSMALP